MLKALYKIEISVFIYLYIVRIKLFYEIVLLSYLSVWRLELKSIDQPD